MPLGSEIFLIIICIITVMGYLALFYATGNPKEEKQKEGFFKKLWKYGFKDAIKETFWDAD